MFWLRNKTNNFLLRSLNWGPGCYLLTEGQSHLKAVSKESDKFIKCHTHLIAISAHKDGNELGVSFSCCFCFVLLLYIPVINYSH